MFGIKTRLKNFISSQIHETVYQITEDKSGDISKQNYHINSRPCVYLGNNKILTKNIWGQKFICHGSDISLTPHIVLDGYWEMWITKVFMQYIQPGMTVLDIGANIGYYSLLAASIVGECGRVIAFEANPSLADIIASNFAINGYSHFTEVNNLAVYSRMQTLEFSIFKKHMGSSSIFCDDNCAKRAYDTVSRVTVKAVSLDDFFPAGTKIDFIKMDAECAEPYILDGAKRIISENKNISILMEWKPKQLFQVYPDLNKLIKTIYDHGFTFYKIKTDSTLVECTDDMVKNLEPCDIILKRQ